MTDVKQKIDVIGMAKQAQDRIAQFSPSKQEYLRRVMATACPKVKENETRR